METKRALKKYLAFIIIAAAIIIFSLLLTFNPKNSITAPKERVWSVTAVPVKLSKISPIIQLYGKIETPRHTTLESALPAYVKSTPVLEGHSIHKGQTIIILDNRDAHIAYRRYQADVKSLQAKIATEHNRYKFDKSALAHELIILTNRKKQVGRIKSLTSKKLAAQALLETEQSRLKEREVIINKRRLVIANHKNRLMQLEAELEKAKALSDQAKLDLERTTIISPFNGKLAKLFVSVGDRVNVGDKLAEIFDTSKLETRAPIPNQYINTLQQALTNKKSITATINFHGKMVELTLSRLSSTVTFGRAAVDGIFSLPTDAQTVPLGLSLQLLVKLPPIDNVFAIPAQALYENSIVYKLRDNRMVAQKINVAGSTTINKKEFVLIKCPKLKSGDKIITTSIPGAITGLKVEAVETTS